MGREPERRSGSSGDATSRSVERSRLPLIVVGTLHPAITGLASARKVRALCTFDEVSRAQPWLLSPSGEEHEAWPRACTGPSAAGSAGCEPGSVGSSNRPQSCPIGRGDGRSGIFNEQEVRDLLRTQGRIDPVLGQRLTGRYRLRALVRGQGRRDHASRSGLCLLAGRSVQGSARPC